MRSFVKSVGSGSSWLVALALCIGAGTLGCGDKTTPPPVVSAQPVPEEIAKLPLAELAPPADVVLFGSVEDVAKITAPLADMASVVNPMAGALKSQLPTFAAQTLGLTKPDALDFTKPVRVAVLDPKKHVGGFGVFVVHVKDEASLIASSPANRALNDKGNAYSWDIQGGKMYVNLVGNVAVFAMDAGVFAADQQFFKQLTVATAPPGATFISHAATVATLYGPDLDAALAKMKENQAKLDETQARAMGNVISVDQGVLEAAKELETVTISLRPTDDGLVLGFTLRPRAGTPLEVAFKSLKAKGDNPLLARFPKSAIAYASGSLSPDSLQSMQTAMKWLLTLSLPPEQASQYMTGWSDIVAASTGDFVLGAYPTKDGFAVGGMSGVKDADRARAAQAAMLKMTDDPGVKAALEKSGIKSSVKAKAYTIGDVDVAVVKNEMKNLPPGAMASALSPFMETHSAVGSDAAVFAYGSAAKETLTMLLEGKGKDSVELGLDKGPGVLRAAKNGAANSFFHAFMMPAALSAAPGAPADGAGIVLTVGAKDGTVEADFDVPTSQVGPIVAALGALRSAAMPDPHQMPGGAPSGITVAPPPKPKN